MKEIQITYLPVDKLKPNSWNPNRVTEERQALIERSLDDDWFKPIIVRSVDDGWEILAGEHRWLAAKKKNFATIPCVDLGTVTDTRAKQITIIDDNSYGEYDPQALADMLKTMSPDELEILPYDSEQMEAMLSLSDIDFDSLSMPDVDTPEHDPTEDAREGASEDDHRTIRFKVPIDRVDAIMAVIDLISQKEGIEGADVQKNMGEALFYLAENY